MSFAYPVRSVSTLNDINLSVQSGEFVTLCGKSGCGKTTLLRLLKPPISPHGSMSGEILYKDMPIGGMDERLQATEIGFVMQNPDSQIVTDKVWHELAFGLESLGMKTEQIRTKVAEMASFFGIQGWFHKKTDELSGGQKQLLNLASVMVMQPRVLILDEPTSQLDPIAAYEFLRTVRRINDEFGTTVILSEHRLEEAFPLSDRVIVMDGGRIAVNTAPQEAGRILKEKNHDMFDALPVPMRVFAGIGRYPLSIREGKAELEKYMQSHSVNAELIPEDSEPPKGSAAIEIKNAFFRYDKNLPDVINGLNLTVNRGEFFAIVGGNGAGKTTALTLAAGLNKPQRGKVLINGADISGHDGLYDGLLGVLPQNPQTLFARKTVYLDLFDITDRKMSDDDRKKRVHEAARMCEIENLLQSHPYDLSGGEQQRAALAMLLIKNPKILILDEPTKGIDAHFKKTLAGILNRLKASGAAILIVSHDIEFCAEFADRCAMFFDGSITATGAPREFFCGNSFYTTSANRMARDCVKNVLLADDLIATIGKTPREDNRPVGGSGTISEEPPEASIREKAPQSEPILKQAEPRENSAKKLSKRTLFASLFLLAAVPLTIWFGIYRLGDRKYYFISLLIILEVFLPFITVFEGRKPQARELVIISVLCAIGVAGRAAFYMLPEFKPVLAIVVISGICFGGETGFLVGAVTAFVSNFFFGQGPWTPWQMFAFGTVGFIAGVVFKKGLLPKTRAVLALFGFVSALVIYGVIMNVASVLMMTTAPNTGMIVSSLVMGLPFDLIHALSSAFFLWFISEPMTEKLERVKLKYGLLD